METNNEIKLVQSPVIAHKLQEVGAQVAKRLQDLNLENMVATVDTVKSLKEIRAELNKELKEFEEQRKFIKNGVNNPYNEFEAIYKIEISDRYNLAEQTLKDKITSVEIKIKDEKKESIKTYFVELCLSENIDFVCFDQLGLDINLSTTEKAYKEKCNEFISKVQDDLKLIKSLDSEAEIMAEYKVTLNASKAIQDVKDRKERERQEAERIKLIEQNRRIAEFKRIGMIPNTETKALVYNDEIYVSWDSVKDIEKVDFANKIIELEEKIKASKVEPPIDFKSEPKKEVKEVISAPVVETKLEILTAAFEVKGTMQQLKALSEYMKTNNLTYKNI